MKRSRWPLVLLLASLPTIVPLTAVFLLREPDRYRLAKGPGPADADVLIVYSVGTPFKTISDVTLTDLDAVTAPTPMTHNTGTIAVDLGEALVGRGLKVRVAEADRIQHPREILRHRVMVLGTPTHFWNVDWNMKKFLDERMEPLYVGKSPVFRSMRVAGFSMAEIQPSADQALDKIGAVISDCGNTLAVRMAFLAGDNEDQYSSKLARLADGIQTLIAEAGR